MNRNQVYTQSSTAFGTQISVNMNPTAPPNSKAKDIIPCGARVNADGEIFFSMYAPNAKNVKVLILPDKEYELNKKENGLWEKSIKDAPDGFLTISFYVDGSKVLNEMAPIGFGSCHPINYVDVPAKSDSFFEIKNTPHGSVRHEYFYSETTKKYEACVVYTPPEYDNFPQKKYPVLYLQHGHGENEKCWVWQGKVNFIMDNLLNANQAAPCIIVMNNGMVMLPNAEGERYLDAGAFENLLLNDCIPYIESRFRVAPGKENRAMAGLSMGSMQTSMITLDHPDMFSYVGLFSGFMRNLMSKDTSNAHLNFLDNKPEFEKSFNVFFRAMGLTDQFVNIFYEDDEILKEKGLSTETCKNMIRKEYSGAHEWKVWRECIRDFLPLLWKK